MYNLIGYSAYNGNAYESNLPPIRDSSFIRITNSMFDEIHIRENNNPYSITKSKIPWQTDTRFLAKFLDDLEAGNVQNEGVQIEKFSIKRRNIDDFDNITLGYMDFKNDTTIEYTDYTQPNNKFIYSIVPVGENELEGRPNEVYIESDFVGWWIVDKDKGLSLGFDASIQGSGDEISVNLNQGRVQIDTMTKYPSIYYTDQEYSEFTLEASFIPYEWERSGYKFEEILNQFAKNHKPFIVKGSDGSVYVADVHSPVKTVPRNAYKNFDYVKVSISCIEVQDYKEFVNK